MSRAKSDEPSFIVSSCTKVANFFGVHADTVRRDWRAAGMPGKERRYDLSAIAKWKTKRFQEQLQNRAKPETDEDVERLKLRKFVAEVLSVEEEARGRKLANDLKEGLVCPVDEVSQAFSMLCARIKERLEAAPDEFEMEFPAQTRIENKIRLEDFIRQLLDEMSDFEPVLTAEVEDDE